MKVRSRNFDCMSAVWTVTVMTAQKLQVCMLKLTRRIVYSLRDSCCSVHNIKGYNRCPDVEGFCKGRRRIAEVVSYGGDCR